MSISVSNMDKFEKERTNKEESIYKKTLGMTGMIG